MTRDEVELIQEGDDMDSWIAQEVMGLARIDLGNANCPYCNSEMWHGKNRSRCTQCNEWRYSPYKDYSTDIAASWEVVEKLMNDGFIYSSGGNDVCGNLVFSVTFIRDEDGSGEDVKKYYSGITEYSLPLAICRAALLAVMEDK